MPSDVRALRDEAARLREQNERLLLADNRYQELLDSIDVGVLISGPDGKIIDLNSRACELAGVDREELLGTIPGQVLGLLDESGRPFLPHEMPAYRLLATGAPIRGEVYGFDLPSGQRRWVLCSGEPHMGPDGKVAYGVTTAVDITEQRMAEARLRESLDHVQKLSRRMEALREEERARVAREIHDELGQALTGLKMDVSLLRQRCLRKDDPPLLAAIADRLGGTIGIIDATIDAVRRIATELRPAILDTLGLVAALEWLCGDFGKRSGVRCRFVARPEEIPLPEDVSTALFRIVQESLTNVWRHSRATRVDVLLKRGRGELILNVKDNGIGISDASLAETVSFGLISMRERATLIGASFQVESIRPHGTCVAVRVPFAWSPTR